MTGSFLKFLLTILAFFAFVFYYWVIGNSQKQVNEQFMFVEGRPDLSYDFFTPLLYHETSEQIDSVVAMYENYADSGIYLLQFKNSQVKENHEHFLIKAHTERDSIGYQQWRSVFEGSYVFEDYRCFTIEGSDRYFNVSWVYFEDVKMYPLDYLNKENLLKIHNHLVRLLPPDEPIKIKVLKKDIEDSTSMGVIEVYEIYNREDNLILRDQWSLDQLKTSTKRNGPMDLEEIENSEFILWHEPLMFKVGLFFIGFTIVVALFSWLFMRDRKAFFDIDIEEGNNSLKWTTRKKQKVFGPFEIPQEELLVVLYANTHDLSVGSEGEDVEFYGIVFCNKVTDEYYHMIARDYNISPKVLNSLGDLPERCLTLLKADDVLETTTSDGEWTHSYVIEGEDDHVYHSTYFL